MEVIYDHFIPEWVRSHSIKRDDLVEPIAEIVSKKLPEIKVDLDKLDESDSTDKFCCTTLRCDNWFPFLKEIAVGCQWALFKNWWRINRPRDDEVSSPIYQDC